MIVSNRRSSEASQRAVRGNQGQSGVIMSNWMAISSTQRHSEPLRGHQRSSEALRGTQRHSKALRGTQTHSDAIRRNQTQSDALRGTQKHSAALSGPSEGTGTRDGHEDPDCQRHHWWRDGGARAPVCCAIVVRTSPSLSPLTTLAPPPSFSACPRRSVATRRPTSQPITITTPRSRPSSRAARCARFACNQRVLSGHQRVLRGHAEAIRGTQWPSEGSQRPVSGTQKGHPRPSEGTQRHSQAIRGHSEAILGNHSQSAALRRTQWQSRGRRDPRRPRWPHRVLSVPRARVRVRVFAALAGNAARG